MPRAWRWAWKPMSPSSTARSTGCASSMSSSAPSLNTMYSTVDAIESNVIKADLVIGAVLVPGRRGAEAGDPQACSSRCGRARCWSTSPSTRAAASRPAIRPPTPTRSIVVDGVVHYCVANMPGAVARTSTFALNNATLPFALALADKGYRRACADDRASAERPQRPRRQADLQGGRRCAEAKIHAGAGGAGRLAPYCSPMLRAYRGTRYCDPYARGSRI